VNEYKAGKEYLLNWQVETKKGEKVTIAKFDRSLHKGHLFTYSEYVEVYQVHPGVRNPPVELRTDILVFKRVNDNSSIVIPAVDNLEKYVIIQEVL